MKTLIIIGLIILSTASFGQTGREIIERYENEMEAKDQSVTLTMKLVSKNGKTRERTLNWSSMTNANDQTSSYLYFSAPADIKGTAFLTIENESGNNDQWLYLPALKRSRRISSDEKNKSFMGSDFTYEDIGDENMNESNYKLIESLPSDSGLIYVIEASYKEATKIKESGYSKRFIYINKSNNLMVKTDFFGTDGKKIKTLICSDFKQSGEAGKWRPYSYQMTNLEKGTSTLLLFDNYQINKGIDPEIFTIRYLESK